MGKIKAERGSFYGGNHGSASQKNTMRGGNKVTNRPKKAFPTGRVGGKEHQVVGIE